jgi:hypothetical protein
LIVGAKTLEERNDWLTLMQGKVLYLQYLALCRKEQIRPDPRVISLCGRFVSNSGLYVKARYAYNGVCACAA